MMNYKSMANYVDYMVRLIDSDCWIGSNTVCFGNGDYCIGERRGVRSSSIPARPTINNLDSLLHDVYLRYIALNDDDFENYYSVVHNIFLQMHSTMKRVDPYYRKYSSNIQFVGSHPDRLRIKKPDEFDIDITIDMPLSFRCNAQNPAKSDFLLEPDDPGFFNLKMGPQYQRLPNRDPSVWNINKRAHQWKDDENYLLRTKFKDWLKSVVMRSLNEFKENKNSRPVFYVGSVPYTVRTSESGPAMTLYVENQSKNFKLDVDLVFGLRFPIDRWPDCGDYREVPEICQEKGYWMLVPKWNKATSGTPNNRSWRVAMHEQERMLMHNTYHMRQAIRLMKKLRDAQNMNELASYYIKTLFFWEVMFREKDRAFWHQSPAFLFKYMLTTLHQCLIKGYIPYFWNNKHNLIADNHVNRQTLIRYANIVGRLLNVLNNSSDFKEVAKFLLTPEEYEEYSEILHVSLTTKLKNFICRAIFYMFCIYLFVIVVANIR